VLVYDVQSTASFDKLEALREQFIRQADIADAVRDSPLFFFSFFSPRGAEAAAAPRAPPYSRTPVPPSTRGFASPLPSSCMQADFPFVVLGNKVDVDAKRQAVQQSAVKAWCESKGGIPHFLVSAKEGTNVETGFLSVVTAAAKRIKHEDPILPDTVKLELTRKDKSDGCAC
jgi:hypothetical protein